MNAFRYFILASLISVVPCTSAMAAQEPDSVSNIVDHLEKSGKAVIVQDSLLTNELNKQATRDTPGTDRDDDNADQQHVSSRSRSGFRVEVYADNNVRTAKIQAANRKRQLQTRLPQYRTYLVFEAPFWRVRLGDFTTRSAAENALAEVRKAFPSFQSGLRVVRSAINP